MKMTCSIAFSAALLILAAGCGPGGRSAAGSRGVSGDELKASTNMTRTGGIPADIKKFDVVNSFGSVRITGTDSGETRWTWKLTARARTEPLASEAAAAAKCVAERDGDHMQVVVTLPETDGKWSFTSDLEITVPAAASVSAENSFGKMAISGLASDVKAVNQHGALELRDVRGEISAETSFASMSVNDVGAAILRNQHGGIEVSDVAGALDARTSFGSLSARDISGAARLRNQHGSVEVQTAASADARTSFGRLAAGEIRGDAVLVNEHGKVDARVLGSLRAETSFAPMNVEAGGPEVECRNEHGSIKVRAHSEKLIRLEARTSFGSLEVRLPAGLKPAIQARSTFGEIDSDFPVLMKKGKDAFAEVESGTPRLTVENQNGDIRILKE